MITYTELKQPVEFIVIHHSLTEDGEVVNWQAIKKYHRDKGWTDVGYHFGLDLIGDEVEVMVGRPLNAVGAHVAEQRVNWKSIGICIIGNYDEDMGPLVKTVKFFGIDCTQSGKCPECVRLHRMDYRDSMLGIIEILDGITIINGLMRLYKELKKNHPTEVELIDTTKDEIKKINFLGNF